MSIRRERDARRVAKSVRTHEKTMEAYGNASGWARINTHAMDAYNDTRGNPEAPTDVNAIFPSAKDNNRSSGNVFTPKDYNPRAKQEMRDVARSLSEPNRLGHTIGKGHVTTDKDVTFREFQRRHKAKADSFHEEQKNRVAKKLSKSDETS